MFESRGKFSRPCSASVARLRDPAPWLGSVWGPVALAAACRRVRRRPPTRCRNASRASSAGSPTGGSLAEDAGVEATDAITCRVRNEGAGGRRRSRHDHRPLRNAVHGPADRCLGSGCFGSCEIAIVAHYLPGFHESESPVALTRRISPLRTRRRRDHRPRPRQDEQRSTGLEPCALSFSSSERSPHRWAAGPSLPSGATDGRITRVVEPRRSGRPGESSTSTEKGIGAWSFCSVRSVPGISS